MCTDFLTSFAFLVLGRVRLENRLSLFLKDKLMKNGPHTVGAPANFQSIARIDVPRTMFDRSHTYKTTLDGGYLVPIFVDEALPGDSWTLKYRQLCRMTTPIAPFSSPSHI